MHSLGKPCFHVSKAKHRGRFTCHLPKNVEERAPSDWPSFFRFVKAFLNALGILRVV